MAASEITVEPRFSERQPSGQPRPSGNFSEHQFFYLVKTCNLAKILARAEKFSVTENSAKVRFYCTIFEMSTKCCFLQDMQNFSIFFTQFHFIKRKISLETFFH